MNVTKFLGCNTVYAKDQPQYYPLPCMKLGGPEGQIITCWKITLRERIRVLFTGEVWLSVLTYGKPLQPLHMQVGLPEEVQSVQRSIETLSKEERT